MIELTIKYITCLLNSITEDEHSDVCGYDKDLFLKDETPAYV